MELILLSQTSISIWASLKESVRDQDTTTHCIQFTRHLRNLQHLLANSMCPDDPFEMFRSDHLVQAARSFSPLPFPCWLQELMTLVKISLAWSAYRPIHRARRMLELINFIFKRFSKMYCFFRQACEVYASLESVASLRRLDRSLEF